MNLASKSVTLATLIPLIVIIIYYLFQRNKCPLCGKKNMLNKTEDGNKWEKYCLECGYNDD